GHDTLSVYRPRTAVLVTGDEVTPSGVPAPGTVRDAIGPMLPGIAAWAGARADPPVQVRDRVDRTAGALRAAAGSGADVIAVCGASSKGPADHLRAALEALGAEVVVDGVACRPGHPQLLAHLGPPSAPGPAVVGLPGNPNAALAAALTLLVPLLAAIGGRPDPAAAAPARARGLEGVEPHPRDTRLVAVRAGEDGVRPIGHDRPGSLRSPAAADACAGIAPGRCGPDAVRPRLPRRTPAGPCASGRGAARGRWCRLHCWHQEGRSAQAPPTPPRRRRNPIDDGAKPARQESAHHPCPAPRAAARERLRDAAGAHHAAQTASRAAPGGERARRAAGGVPPADPRGAAAAQQRGLGRPAPGIRRLRAPPQRGRGGAAAGGARAAGGRGGPARRRARRR